MARKIVSTTSSYQQAICRDCAWELPKTPENQNWLPLDQLMQQAKLHARQHPAHRARVRIVTVIEFQQAEAQQP